MGNNKAMPFYDSSIGINKVVNQFSIGEAATDQISVPFTTSAIDEINSINGKVTSGSLPLSPTGQVNVSTIVDLYRQFTAGASLNAGGASTNYGLGDICGAQVMSFTLSAFPETWSKYHNAKNGYITLTLDPETAQRTAANWDPSRQGSGSTRSGSWIISVEGNGTTTIDPHIYTPSSVLYIAENLHGPYTLQVTVTDTVTNLTMRTVVSTTFQNPTPQPNAYQRIPYRMKVNSGAWSDDGNNTYFS